MRVLKTFLRTKAPNLHRELVVLARWLSKIRSNAWAHVAHIVGVPQSHAGVESWEKYSCYDYDGMVAIIADALDTKSVVDVGCGEGTILQAFRTRGSANVLGMEFSERGRERCRERGIACFEIDLLRPATHAPLLHKTADYLPFTVATCFEVLEHIPFWRAGSSVQLLCRLAPCVVFSAAHPLQRGIGHLNEQPQEYWRRKFAKYDMRFDPLVSQRIRDSLLNVHVPPWYKMNIQVFRACRNRPR